MNAQRQTVWIMNPFDNLPMEGNRPQRYWLMARAFAAAGWRVLFWTSDFSHATKRKRVSGGRWSAVSGEIVDSPEPGIQVMMIPTRPYAKNVCLARIRSHLDLASTFRHLAASAPGPQLIVSSTPPLGLCAAAMDVAKACGARFVCDIQDAWPETFYRLLPRGFKRLGALLFASMHRTARRIYREADVVTGVCSRYAELSGRTDFYLSYHGIEGKAVGGQRSAVSGAKTVHLVYAGNLGAGYELGTVIEAVAKKSDLTLDIAGLGPREEELRAQVRRLGIADRVRFHGYLGADDLRQLMTFCNVGVIPMRDDSWVGLPYKLGDYLAAGLHVVSSLRGECGALLERTGYGSTYERTSADSLLAALAALRPTAVQLPEELMAEAIYPAYVRRVS